MKLTRHNMNYFRAIFLLTAFTALAATGQNTRSVLFLGNSYTAAHNLPQMVADAALSAGDTLLFDSNTPGGLTLQGHTTNATSLNKIYAGNFDYVVLQEQSQRPSFPISQVLMEVFPYAEQLCQLIRQHNPCAEPMFYMTWGRKNGDATNCASWPPVCTYEGMDSLLRLRYMMMADSNSAVVSPVGALWRYIRDKYPDIELYEADESHPSAAGSYAAACSFYAAIFRKDPLQITWNSSLNAADASRIRLAASVVVFDSLATWRIGEYNPSADFSYSLTSGSTVDLINLSVNASQYLWHFGDGNTSVAENPSHQYISNGHYEIKLIASRCAVADSITKTVEITAIGTEMLLSNKKLIIYPNPATDILHIRIEGHSISRVTVADLTGRIRIVPFVINGDSGKLDISGLAPGSFLLMVYSNDGVVSKSVIIKGAHNTKMTF